MTAGIDKADAAEAARGFGRVQCLAAIRSISTVNCRIFSAIIPSMYRTYDQGKRYRKPSGSLGGLFKKIKWRSKDRTDSSRPP
jgi:hypothetical protein